MNECRSPWRCIDESCPDCLALAYVAGALAAQSEPDNQPNDVPAMIVQAHGAWNVPILVSSFVPTCRC